MSKDVLAAILVVTELSRVGAPPLHVFLGARVAETAVLHRDVSAVILGVSAPTCAWASCSVSFQVLSACPQAGEALSNALLCGDAHFPKFHSWIVAAFSRILLRQQQQGLATLLP